MRSAVLASVVDSMLAPFATRVEDYGGGAIPPNCVLSQVGQRLPKDSVNTTRSSGVSAKDHGQKLAAIPSLSIRAQRSSWRQRRLPQEALWTSQGNQRTEDGARSSLRLRFSLLSWLGPHLSGGLRNVREKASHGCSGRDPAAAGGAPHNLPRRRGGAAGRHGRTRWVVEERGLTEGCFSRLLRRAP